MSSKKSSPFDVLTASSIVIPLLLFSLIIWQDYKATINATRIEALRTSRTLQQHALNVIETHQLITEQIDEKLNGMTWDEIAHSTQLQSYLKKIVAEYPQTRAVWLADASGIVRNGSEPLPAEPVSIVDRDYFRALREKNSGLFIGHIVKPKVLKTLNFNIASRRDRNTQKFNGVIVLTVIPEYFTDFWNRITPKEDCAIALLRGDGAILSRAPKMDPERLYLPSGSTQVKAMKKSDHGTFAAVAVNDGLKRIYGFHKLDKYDVYVLYGTNMRSVLRDWRNRALYYGFFFGLALVVLLWSAWAYKKHSRSELAALQALRESEEKLRLLGDNLPDSAVYQYQHDADGTPRFTYFSAGVERLNGVRVEDVLRDAGVLHRQIDGDYFALLAEAEARSKSELSDFDMVVPMRRPDGEERWMQLHSRPRRLTDGRVVWDGVQSDVTARKKTEEALRKLNEELDLRVAERTRELREKNDLMIQQSRLAAMGEMIHNIAHQWRQPLNTLGLNIQQLPLFYEMGQFNQAFLDKTVDHAMSLIQYMSKTIDDFRDFFKPGKEMEDFKISQVVASARQLSKASFDSHQIRIEINQIDDPVVHGFPNEYSQVILNILTNAKDALVANKTADPLVKIATFVEDGRSVVTISDNAGGIPESIIFKVFDPHFSTKGPQGTGIGLFMGKNIIERNMNGRLTVRNCAEGAEFRIEV